MGLVVVSFVVCAIRPCVYRTANSAIILPFIRMIFGVCACTFIRTVRNRMIIAPNSDGIALYVRVCVCVYVMIGAEPAVLPARCTVYGPAYVCRLSGFLCQFLCAFVVVVVILMDTSTFCWRSSARQLSPGFPNWRLELVHSVFASIFSGRQFERPTQKAT